MRQPMHQLPLLHIFKYINHHISLNITQLMSNVRWRDGRFENKDSECHNPTGIRVNLQSKQLNTTHQYCYGTIPPVTTTVIRNQNKASRTGRPRMGGMIGVEEAFMRLLQDKSKQ